MNVTLQMAQIGAPSGSVPLAIEAGFFNVEDNLHYLVTPQPQLS